MATEAQTNALREAAVESGKTWFGPTVLQNRLAFRVSMSSLRTTDDEIDDAIDLLTGLRKQISGT